MDVVEVLPHRCWIGKDKMLESRDLVRTETPFAPLFQKCGKFLRLSGRGGHCGSVVFDQSCWDRGAGAIVFGFRRFPARRLSVGVRYRPAVRGEFGRATDRRNWVGGQSLRPPTYRRLL